jgi:hypothetical protein
MEKNTWSSGDKVYLEGTLFFCSPSSSRHEKMLQRLLYFTALETYYSG